MAEPVVEPVVAEVQLESLKKPKRVRNMEHKPSIQVDGVKVGVYATSLDSRFNSILFSEDIEDLVAKRATALRDSRELNNYAHIQSLIAQAIQMLLHCINGHVLQYQHIQAS